MQGSHPHHFVQGIDTPEGKAEIQGLLEELECLAAMLDPESRDPAQVLVGQLRDRLGAPR